MKIRNIIAAAGLVVAALGTSGAAQAQPYHGEGRRGDYNRPGWHDNGRHRGWENRRGGNGGRHCWTEWRHHHRVRVCR